MTGRRADEARCPECSCRDDADRVPSAAALEQKMDWLLGTLGMDEDPAHRATVMSACCEGAKRDEE